MPSQIIALFRRLCYSGSFAMSSCFINRTGIVILFIILIAGNSLAQMTTPKVTFNTPEVTAFNRFIETPVSYYSGIPDISIPLYEIKINGVSLPVSLNYNAGGIRVDEEATSVGLGWSFNYGGTVSRKMKGRPDEFYYLMGGSHSSLTSVQNFNALPDHTSDPYTSLRASKLRNAKLNTSPDQVDFMPDEFYFSTLGYKGKFMFSQQQQKFILFPKDDILIQDYGSDGVLNVPFSSFHPLNGWKLTLPDGVSAEFGRDGTVIQSRDGGDFSPMMKVAWNIKAIRNNFNDSITFAYQTSNYEQYRFAGERYTYMRQCNDNQNQQTHTITKYNYTDVRLREITFPSGKITVTETDREDMPAGVKKLSELVVVNKLGETLKRIKFHYSYFFGNKYDALPKFNTYLAGRISPDQRYKRLKLDSLSIVSSDAGNVTYKFEYYLNNQDLPAKISFAQDHWGFYNGIDNNTLIPPIWPAMISGGNRRVKEDKTKAFSLKSITYPEGGKTEFVYEGNVSESRSVPLPLLSLYVDDHFQTKTMAISFSGRNNNHFFPLPGVSNPDGTYTFRNTFTIANSAEVYSPNGWRIFTDYGVYRNPDMQSGGYYGTGSIDFILSRINADNSRTVIKSFKTYNVGTNATMNDSQEVPMQIFPGKYEMSAVVYPYQGYPPPSYENSHSTFFSVTWRERTSTYEQVNQIYTGGQRIKQINYYNYDNTLVKQKEYRYVKPVSATNHTLTNLTSGKLVSFPQYIRAIINRGSEPCQDRTWIDNGLELYSNSVLPLETTSGAYLGYEYVTEMERNQNQDTLRTDYRFSFVDPVFTPYFNNYTYAIQESKEWERGKLLSKKSFVNGKVLQTEDYTYYAWSPSAGSEAAEEYVEEINTDLISTQSLSNANGGTVSYGTDFYDHPDILGLIALGQVGNRPAGDLFTYGVSPYNNVRVPYFKRNTGFDKLRSKKTTTYSDLGTPVVQNEDYSYNRTPYHYQLTGLRSLSSIGQLKEVQNLYPQDITLSGIAEEGRQALISGHQIASQLQQRTVINGREQTIQTDYYADPLHQTVTPRLSKTNTGTGGSFETRAITLFDKKGNLQEVRMTSGSGTVYLWSYNNQYPVAEISNADYNTIVSLSGGTDAIKNFGNSIPTDAQINAFLAPVRNFYPQTVVYTYKPLVGMTSKTDAKGQTEYYDYDGLGRLFAIRDNQGNIVKTFCYNYKGDRVDCNLPATEGPGTTAKVTIRLQSLTGRTNLSYASILNNETGGLVSTIKFPDNVSTTSILQIPLTELMSGKLSLEFSSLAYRPMFPDYRPAVNYKYQLEPVGPLWKISDGTGGNMSKLLKVPLLPIWFLQGNDFAITMDFESPSVVVPGSDFYPSSNFSLQSNSITLSSGRVTGSLALQSLSAPSVNASGFAYAGAFSDDAYLPLASRQFISGNWLCEIQAGVLPRLYIKWIGSGSPAWSSGSTISLMINYNK